MTIHLYTVCWNEVEMLGFFFRHYDPWVDRYFIYDDGSTDGSLERLRAHPKVEVRRFVRTHADSFVLSHRIFHNEAWKESRGKAGWVIVTALDEHLQVKGCQTAEYLAASARQGVTLIPALGYQMISDDYPDPGEYLAVTRTRGAPCYYMNKLSIFNPDALVETGYGVGRHKAEPSGDLRLPERDELMLLHYKYLNFDRTLGRHRLLSQGLGGIDVANGWGSHYLWPADSLREQWMDYQAKAIDTGRPDFQPGRIYEPPRWWHPDDFRNADQDVLDMLQTPPGIRISPDSSNLPHCAAVPLFNLERAGGLIRSPEEPVEVALHDALDFTGWAVDQAAQSHAGGVNIVIDGTHYPAIYGTSRADVARHFGVGGYAFSGFTCSIPASRIGLGEHQAAVHVIGRDGDSVYAAWAVVVRVR
jgi:hypothetical protein